MELTTNSKSKLRLRYYYLIGVLRGIYDGEANPMKRQSIQRALEQIGEWETSAEAEKKI